LSLADEQQAPEFITFNKEDLTIEIHESLMTRDDAGVYEMMLTGTLFDDPRGKTESKFSVEVIFP